MVLEGTGASNLDRGKLHAGLDLGNTYLGKKWMRFRRGLQLGLSNVQGQDRLFIYGVIEKWNMMGSHQKCCIKFEQIVFIGQISFDIAFVF